MKDNNIFLPSYVPQLTLCARRWLLYWHFCERVNVGRYAGRECAWTASATGHRSHRKLSPSSMSQYSSSSVSFAWRILWQKILGLSVLFLGFTVYFSHPPDGQPTTVLDVCVCVALQTLLLNCLDSNIWCHEVAYGNRCALNKWNDHKIEMDKIARGRIMQFTSRGHTANANADCFTIYYYIFPGMNLFYMFVLWSHNLFGFWNRIFGEISIEICPERNTEIHCCDFSLFGLFW